MIDARLSLVEALDTCAATTRDRALRRVLRDVRADLRQGRSLSESLGRRPAVFDELTVGLVRVGEAAGVLDQVFLRLAEHREKAAAVRRRIRTALVHPVLVLSVAVLVVAFFLTTIVPTFAEMFATFGADLPAPTRLMLRLSSGAGRHGGKLAFLVAVLAAALALFRRSVRGRWFWDRLRLGFPLLGRITRMSLMARFCRTLGTLLSGGVGLLDALDLLSKNSGNRVLDGALTQAVGRVRRGSSLHATLASCALFPSHVVQMIAVGEKTATLDRTMLHVGAHLEHELDAAVEALTAAVEPALIVLLGLVVGGILTALYLPMFELVNVVQ